MQRIGILGGTFDPPHIGHLLLAEYTRESLALDHILFVPAGVQPLKRHTRQTIDHRLAMVDLAIADNAHFSLSRVDIDRPAPHYTADMIPLVQAHYPTATLYLLMGGDSLRDFPKWDRPLAIARAARLAVMRRSDEAVSAIMHDDELPGLSQSIDIVETPLLSIWLSSTHIVERLRAGQSVRYLVPDAVYDYIQEQRLYSGAE